MAFEPGIRINSELSNEELKNIFKCGNMSGIRPSKETNTVVIIRDITKGLYHDIWKNGVLYYTGTGKFGDQNLTGNPGYKNGLLYDSDRNGYEIHLFEVFEKARYTYRGIVKLAGKPYIDRQEDDNGNMRKVWMFPVKLLDENVEIASSELSESDINRLSEQELAKYASIKNINKVPKKTETVVYYRDPYLKEMVKRIADGKCQYCEKEAPFLDKQGKPYLESHHVIGLANGGDDVIGNIVAICPNCHRKIHVLKDESDTVILKNIANLNKKYLERMSGLAEIFTRERLEDDE